MLEAQLCLRTGSGFGAFSDQAYSTRCVKYSFTGSSSFRLSFRFGFKTTPLRGGPRSALISCNSSYRGGFFGARSGNGDDHDYLEASILVPETISHYRMRKQGFGEQFKRPPYGKLSLSIVQAKEPRVRTIEEDFLRRFQSPTIFLKISCDGDFLLPISVGEFAIQKLIDTLQENANGECPDQFELIRDVSERLGCNVKVVRIVERVLNTYFARIYFGKGGNEILSVDARPSDAMIIANRCRAPIYVSKEIVFTDAIRLGYGISRVHDRKPTYDVSLDSAIDGPDPLAEELGLLMNMNLAAKEERYKDAAMLRDKLMKLRYNT
ncbi:bifunctional nuclease 2-like isoform X2 [Tripterygium wilfordii]|uniref:bifunctional nuclease 2-like isoform X2 n=1 Tax=Tripterygium wilfordii TaxID=458696 RepID=UPI0018F81848|nr:bifunctional nuclease 2-like isoform X2 [Tripterygium wilfordii]